MNEKRNCDLCGLPVVNDFPLTTTSGRLHFCCEGCKGIYRMLNDVEEIDETAPKGVTVNT